MSDILRLFGVFGAALSGKQIPIIAKSKLKNGLEVSTVDSTDCGPETAIIDKEGIVHVVERYESVEQAEEGHIKWMEHAETLKNGDKLTALGYGDLTDSEEVTISCSDALDR